MDQLIPTAAVLVLNGDKILLVKHSEGAKHLTGVYGLPGGQVDEGESEKETANRELLEETGLTAKLEALVDFPGNVFHAKIQQKDGVKNFSWKVFLCRNYSGELKISDETFPEWVDVSLLSELNLLPNTKDAYQAAKKYLNSLK